MTKSKLMRFLYCKELFMLGLAVTSLTFLSIDQFGHLSHEQLKTLYIYDVTVGFIFIAEFFFELWLTSNRRGYVKSNWFYLLAAIPLPYSIAQLLRGLRIIRVVKVVRFGIHFEYRQSVKKKKFV